jgi:hypothetical protein
MTRILVEAEKAGPQFSATRRMTAALLVLDDYVSLFEDECQTAYNVQADIKVAAHSLQRFRWNNLDPFFSINLGSLS